MANNPLNDCPRFAVLGERADELLRARKVKGLEQVVGITNQLVAVLADLRSNCEIDVKNQQVMTVEEVVDWLSRIDVLQQKVRDIVYYVKSQLDDF